MKNIKKKKVVVAQAVHIVDAVVDWLFDKATESPTVYAISKDDAQTVLNDVSSTKPSSASAGQWASGTPCT